MVLDFNNYTTSYNNTNISLGYKYQQQLMRLIKTEEPFREEIQCSAVSPKLSTILINFNTYKNIHLDLKFLLSCKTMAFYYFSLNCSWSD